MFGFGRRDLAAIGVLTCTTLVAACEDEPDPEPPAPVRIPLARVDAWTYVDDVAADVFGAERPDGIECDTVEGLGLENVGVDPAFEVKTGLCNYATVQQSSLGAVTAGDTIGVRAWHWELVNDEVAQGHMAIAIDGDVVWERWIDIPAAGALLEEEFVADRDYPEGVDVQFHVHNHGINSYDFLGLQATSYPED